MKWRARVEPKLIRRSWDGESAVFSPISGETHFLNAFSDEVLAQLEAQPRGVDELIAHLSDIMPADQAQDMRDNVLSLLHRFDNTGLVEPCHD